MKQYRFLLTGLALIGAPVQILADNIFETGKSTLFSGTFDGVLSIAADDQGKRLSGYYKDGKCRFAFGGALKPVLLFGTPDYGEAYELEGWNVDTPERRFTVEAFSKARGGFQELITLRLGGGDPSTTSKCRSRLTIDRAGNMSSVFIAVRTVRSARPQIYEILNEGAQPSPQPRGATRPTKGDVVWVTRPSSRAYSPTGFVAINWYPSEGPPKGGYVRERDLYAMPAEGNE